MIRIMCFLALLGQDPKSLQEEFQALTECVKTLKTADEAKAMSKEFVSFSLKCRDVEAYDLELKSLEQAEKVSRIARDAATVASISAMAKETALLKREYDRVKDDILKLSTNPQDPDANLAYGKFIGFWKNDLEKALPYLSMGSDPALQQIATRDLAEAQTAEQKIAIGDAWMRFKASGPLKPRMEPVFRERAIHWYRSAWNDLKGFEKEKFRTRIREMTFRPSGPPKGLPEGWHIMPGEKNPPGSGLDASCSRTGKYSFRVVPNSHFRFGGIPAKPGDTFTVSAWVLTDQTGLGNALRIRFFAINGGLGHVGTVIPQDIPFWTFITKTVVAGENTTHADVHICVLSSEGSVWLDDISLKMNDVEILPGWN